MKLGWPLGFGLAAMLLAGGCDFWGNLVDGKKVTQVFLSLKARDALTGKSLPFSVCVDQDRGETFPMDSAGQFKSQAASTGSYSLVCRANGYHDSHLEFTLDRHSDTILASFARLGGQYWYPDEVSPHLDSLWVGISKKGNARVPGEMVFRATPFITTGAIRYRWKSAQHPQFNREWTSPAASNPEWTIALQTLKTDESLDTIYLYVQSRLAGLPDYDVDSVAVAVNWVRNRLPILQIFGAPPNVTVGCKDEGKFFDLVYHANDPDGSCHHVEFESADSTSSLGKFKLSKPCGLGKDLKLPLSNPFQEIFPSRLDSLLFNSNELHVKVWDDNGEKKDSILSFITRPHLAPTISILKKESRPIHYAGMPIEFRFLASVQERGLDKLIIDWGDSVGLDLNLEVATSLPLSIDRTQAHTYLFPGHYLVSARIIDACGYSASYALRPIDVQANSLPELTVDTLGFHIQGGMPIYSIQLSARDADLESRQDSLKVVVNWDEGLADTLKVTNPNGLIDTVLNHYYAKPPPDTYTDLYHLRVTLTDGNNGRVQSKFDVRPP